MNSGTKILSIPTTSYWQFVLKMPANRNLLLLGIGIPVLLFLVFKLLYPYPDFFGDSYSYIYAASVHLDINIWPIGYSKFLTLFHSITYSDLALVAFQYFTMQLVALHFFFTVLYFFNLTGWTRKALALFLFVNPLTLYLCNTINSDALFASLSLLWLTELLWIIQRPRLYQLLLEGVLLFVCFTIRNNAYYFPVIAAIAFILSKQAIGRRIAGTAIPFLFIVPFILHTREASYK
jgi:hypothetical protein